MKKMELGRIIKELREEYYKDNQENFAKRLGVNRVTLARWESADIEPKRATLKVLLGMADEKGYRAGVNSFARAIGPTYSQQSTALDLAQEISYSWSALQGMISFTDIKPGEHFSGKLTADLKELIERLRRGEG